MCVCARHSVALVARERALGSSQQHVFTTFRAVVTDSDLKENRSEGASWFENLERDPDVADVFAAHSGFVCDATETDCWAQSAGHVTFS